MAVSAATGGPPFHPVAVLLLHKPFVPFQV